jgi:predicted Zn-dependent protease
MREYGSPHIDDNRMDLARTTDEQMPAIIQINGKDRANTLFALAYDEIKKNVALHPFDVRYNIQQAQLALTGARLTGNPQYLVDAQQSIRTAMEYSPKRQQLYYILSVVDMYTRDYADAEKNLRKTIADDPRISYGWWRLAGVQLESGDQAAAQKTFLEADALGVKFEGDPAVAELRKAVFATNTLKITQVKNKK